MKRSDHAALEAERDALAVALAAADAMAEAAYAWRQSRDDESAVFQDGDDVDWGTKMTRAHLRVQQASEALEDALDAYRALRPGTGVG